MNKEEYIEYVKEYKRKLHPLVRFQRYLKRYFRKSKYPDPHFELSEKEIQAACKILGWNRPESYYPDQRSNSKQWIVEDVRAVLRAMQECRVYAKEVFKEEQKLEKVA